MNSSALSSIGASAGPASSVSHVARPGTAGFNAAALRNASGGDQSAAVAAQFEAILVRQMLGKTMNSVLGGAESGVAGNVYGDMLTDTLAQQLTAGPGLGLSRYIQQQLTTGPKQAATSSGDSRAGSTSPIASSPSAPNPS